MGGFPGMGFGNRMTVPWKYWDEIPSGLKLKDENGKTFTWNESRCRFQTDFGAYIERNDRGTRWNVRGKYDGLIGYIDGPCPVGCYSRREADGFEDYLSTLML